MQKGYIKIDPGDFSFSEKVKIFMNAEKIIAPVGAVLVNMTFYINKCKILTLVETSITLTTIIFLIYLVLYGMICII